MAANKRIDEDVLAVLRLLVWKDGTCKIDYQIDRKLYEKVNKVLDAAGGKWNRSAKAHLFEGDGETAIRESIATGYYIDAKQAFQFFETPPAAAAQVAATADRLMCLAARRNGHHLFRRNKTTILEPSAGTGNLLAAMAALGYQEDHMVAVDLQKEVLEKLKARLPGTAVWFGDFLEMRPIDKYWQSDIVLLNPPFSNLDDVRHVLHAAKFTKAGGVLVAIMCPAWTYRTTKLAEEFREFIKSCGEHASWELLPEGSFKESGTGVRTGILSVSVANEWRAKPAIDSKSSATTSGATSKKRRSSSKAAS